MSGIMLGSQLVTSLWWWMLGPNDVSLIPSIWISFWLSEDAVCTSMAPSEMDFDFKAGIEAMEGG